MEIVVANRNIPEVPVVLAGQRSYGWMVTALSGEHFQILLCCGARREHPGSGAMNLIRRTRSTLLCPLMNSLMCASSRCTQQWFGYVKGLLIAQVGFRVAEHSSITRAAKHFPARCDQTTGAHLAHEPEPDVPISTFLAFDWLRFILSDHYCA
jgi:hypothetical protein